MHGVGISEAAVKEPAGDFPHACGGGPDREPAVKRHVPPAPAACFAASVMRPSQELYVKEMLDTR